MAETRLERKLHLVWHSMNYRCKKDGRAMATRHGARGISVSDDFSTFKKFYTWAITNGYREGLSIDRRDNNKDYSIGNCRWTTKNVQGRNSVVIHTTNSSGYRGVSLHRATGRFAAYIRVNNKKKHLGYYITTLEAAKVYDKYVIDHKLEHNINGV